MIPTFSRFPEKTLYKILLFLIKVTYEDMKICKHHTLAFFIPGQYKPYSTNDQTAVKVTVSQTEFDMLTTILIGREVIFFGDHAPVSKVILQDAKISKATRKTKIFF